MQNHQAGPIITGTSVLAVKYNEGILLAADCLGSYSSLARFKNIQRLNKVGNKTVLATSGDIGDMQYLLKELNILCEQDLCWEDNVEFSPRSILKNIEKKMYNKRTDMKPLWNTHVVAGFDQDTEKYVLGAVTHKGVCYESDCIATGFGAYLAQPLLRKESSDLSSLTEQKGIELLEKCMRVLYYRDARALDKIQLAKITKTQISITEPYKIKGDWTIGKCI